MKVLPLGLQTTTTTSYDQTKTTLQGRINSRSITDGNGAKTVLGPSPVATGDVFDDTGVAPAGLHCTTVNGRLFIGKGFAAGVWTVSYYTINTSTGAKVWVGDLKLTHTNTGAYTLRGFQVDDTTPSAMKFSWVTTNTTVQQGGWYAAYGVDVADFHTSSFVTYPVATLGSTNKTVYQIGDTASQAAHTVTVADGIGIDSSGAFAYILNGAAATPKFFKFVNTVPTAAPTAGYSQANGTIIVTATLPALTGVILLVNCVKYDVAISHGPNSGSPVITFLTTTNIYDVLASDITNGAATLPSLHTNTMSLSGDYLTPTASFGQYSNYLDKFVIMTSLGKVLVKQNIPNDANAKLLGGNDPIKTETGGTITPSGFGGTTNLCLTMMAGWAVMTNTAIGQRNFVAIDLMSDETSVSTTASGGTVGQIFSSIISPVYSSLNISQGYLMSVYNELAKRSLKPTVQFRTSNFSTGPGVGFDATWTTVPKDLDMSALVNSTSVQFRFLFTLMAETTNPTQINDCALIYTDNTQSSDHWVGASSNTSSSGANPFRVSFRLQYAYATSVPTLYVRGVDDSGNSVVFNTVTNIANFDYTTNNGSSYTPLGTIPNTPLTTEVRFSWTSPDGVARRWAVSES